MRYSCVTAELTMCLSVTFLAIAEEERPVIEAIPLEWQCIDAIIKDNSGEMLVTSPEGKTGRLLSQMLKLDFSETIILETTITQDSTHWWMFIRDYTDSGENGQEFVAFPVVRQHSQYEVGLRRFNLNYAVMDKYADWDRTRKVKIQLFVTDKTTFRDLRLIKTGKPARDIFDYKDTINYRPRGIGNLGDVQPFFFNGQYHVFYMVGFSGRPAPWNHLVSDDLVHWKELGQAIDAGGPGEADEHACGSGSVIEKDGTFYLYYTGFGNHPKGQQQVMMATSKDLIHWTKQPEWSFSGDGETYYNLEKNGPLPEEHGGKGGDQCFRDPYVFRNEEAGEYWMAVVARDLKHDYRSCIGRYVSKDLIHWEVRSPLINTHGMDCPDVFESCGNWYRLGYCAWYDISRTGPAGPYNQPEQYGAVYRFDTEFLGVPKRMWDGRRHILVGWIFDNRGKADAGERSWGGCLSLAREVYAATDGKLQQKPASEVVDYYQTTVTNLADLPEFKFQRRGAWKYLDDGRLAGGDGTGLHRSKCRFEAPGDYFLDARLRLEDRANMTVRFREQDDDGQSGYFIEFHPRNNEVIFGSKYYIFRRKMELNQNSPIKLQAFVRGSLIECFVNDAQGFTIRAYDHLDGDLTFTVDHGMGWIEEMKVKLP